nr:MAG TPA_asm: hypothetical protein [Caudoviricetes sp.]
MLASLFTQPPRSSAIMKAQEGGVCYAKKRIYLYS